jgi:hypothetical protein
MKKETKQNAWRIPEGANEIMQKMTQKWPTSAANRAQQ